MRSDPKFRSRRVWSEEKQSWVKSNSPERKAMLAARRERQRGPWNETEAWWHQHRYMPAGIHKKLGRKSV